MEQKIKKKVLLLSTGDVDGSYEAVYRIASFLANDKEYEVAMVVQKKSKFSPFIYEVPAKKKPLSRRFDNLKESVRNKIPFLKRTYTSHSKHIFFAHNEKSKYTKASDILSIIPFSPDVIVSGMTIQFVNTTTLVDLKEKTNAQIFTLFVDMENITGGCHYAWDCKGYEDSCKNCPGVYTKHEKESIYQNFKIKKKNIAKANIQIIGGSDWTIDKIKKSALYAHQKEMYNVNSCIDTDLFNDKHRKIAKNIFDIPDKSKLIFFGAQSTADQRKGFSYLLEALTYVWNDLDENSRSNVKLLIAGKNRLSDDVLNTINFDYTVIDFITDYRLLSLAYQAADIYVCPSIEDAGPMMISEALACGTPVASFNMGIAWNMVINGYNGYKAELKNSKDLADGIKKLLLLSETEFSTYSRNAMQQVEQYSSEKTVIDEFNKIFDVMNSSEL